MNNMNRTFLTIECRDRLQSSESLMTKVDPGTVRVKIFLMVEDP